MVMVELSYILNSKGAILMETRKVVAGYYRLSVEDADNTNDSSSIITQRQIIKKYIAEHKELSEYEFWEFYDDGYSGANMNRPEIGKLLNKMKNQEIACIVVKDFSRFSRDYIELGSYLEQIFPFLGIRFISVSDSYDSNDYIGRTTDLDVEFKGLIADFYCKEVSAKIKTAYQQKWDEGKFVSASTPFGYSKNPKDRYELQIVPQEAEVIRRIFQMKLDGLKSVEMCKILNTENVPTPRVFKQMRKGVQQEESVGKKTIWGKSLIRSILTDRNYIGDMVCRKSYVKEVSSTKVCMLPPDEWKIIENHHVPIIGLAVFEEVQRMIPKHKTIKGTPNPSVLRGKLVCGNCGYRLSFQKQKYANVALCSKKSEWINNNCIKGSVRLDIVEKILLESIKGQVRNLVAVEEVKQDVIDKHNQNLQTLRMELEQCLKREKEIKLLQSQRYEKYRLGEISKELFLQQKGSEENEVQQLQEQVESVKVKLQEMSMIEHEDTIDIEKIMQYAGMEKLNQEMVDTFVDIIHIYDDRTMVIEWTFNEKTVMNIV